MGTGKKILDFIRYKDSQYERVIWTKNPKGAEQKFNITKHPIQPSPEQYVALAESKYNELSLM